MDFLQAFRYSYRYMAVTVVAFYFMNLDETIFTLSFWLLAYIPLNFLALKFGVFKLISKTKGDMKNYLSTELQIILLIFNLTFLILNKINPFVIIFAVIANSITLFAFDTMNVIKKK